MKELNADQLIERAQKETGLDRFDSESFREGLDVFIRAYNATSRPEAFVERNADLLVTILSNRLKTTDYLDKRPELLERPVEKPVFVMGIPRTGTTLLSNLLACDPARRSALTWEIDDPVPPATSETLKSDPRALARLEQERKMLEENPEAGKYYRNSAVYPNECIFFMEHDFKAMSLESRGRLPEYCEFLMSTDMVPTYRYHKRFLQLLQADAPGVWNLKMPSHALYLEALLTVYPDARLVWTHRDPFTATTSICSLNSLGHMYGSGEIDAAWLGEDMGMQCPEHVNRIMDLRDRLGEDRVVDVHYAELTNRPIETMRALYRGLGDEFTPEAEAAMQAWLDVNPQNKFGRHEYNLARFGLSLEQLTPRFERYLSRYEVAREGKEAT